MSTSMSPFRTILTLSVIAAFLTVGLGGCGFIFRDDYMGKHRPYTKTVPRDEMGNPILPDQKPDQKKDDQSL